jgi:hypothetical protein
VIKKSFAEFLFFFVAWGVGAKDELLLVGIVGV